MPRLPFPAISALEDRALRARVLSRWPLLYAGGARAADDRPAFVRAGSGLTWFSGRLAVVQDDASFVALVDPTTRVVDSVALPPGEGGRRLFDDTRGNKAKKLDLESCCTVRVDGRETLLAFGSGSTPARERVALVHLERGGASARLVDAHPLYAGLRACPELAGSKLNVEGVVEDAGHVRFFQRGNGEPREGVSPVNAVLDVPWEDVWACLTGSLGAPQVASVCVYDLGSLGKTPLSFTDATRARGGPMLYVAAAEASPDAVEDGPVSGSVVGVISGQRARFAPLVLADGAAFVEKVEGIALDPANRERAFVVLDADDPTRPSELCEVALEGPWL